MKGVTLFLMCARGYNTLLKHYLNIQGFR